MELFTNSTKKIKTCLALLFPFVLIACSDSYNIDLETSQLEQTIEAPSSKITIAESSNVEIKLSLAFKVTEDTLFIFSVNNSEGDFNKDSWSVIVPKGEKIISTSLAALSDDTAEDNEEFILTVSDPTGAVLKKAQSFAVNIPANTVVDNTPPILSLNAPVNSGNINSSNQNAFAISGTCNENGRNIVLSHGTGALVCDGTNFSGNINFSEDSEGAFNLSATLTDDSGNTGSSNSIALNKDSEGPTTTIGAPSTGSIGFSTTVQFAVSFVGALSVDLTPEKISITGNNNNCKATVTDGSTINPTITIAGCTSSNGSIQIQVLSNAALDAHENSSSSSNISTAVSISNPVQNDFITRWTFTSANYEFTLPLKSGLNYNFTVDWGDASPLSNITSFADIDKTHTYVNAGTYTITISGTCEGFQNSSTHKSQLIEVISLGDTGWKDLSSAFRSNNNLIYVSGGNTSLVTNMNSMFRSAYNALVDTSNWNTSEVTDMGDLFASVDNVDPDTSNWNTAKVEDMSSMFSRAYKADPDTSNWDTSEVLDMSYMFFRTENASPDTTNWNTAKVEDMSNMFSYALVANPDTTNWNTSKVENMANMFQATEVANPNTANWITSSVQNMSHMFHASHEANPDTSNWITSEVTDMSAMFASAQKANPDTSDWITAKVENMSSMFNNSPLANPNTTDWNTSEVTNMSSMFNNSVLANPNTTNWNTSKVENMANMFNAADSANPDSSGWNLSAVNTNSTNVLTNNTNLSVTNYSAFLIQASFYGLTNGSITTTTPHSAGALAAKNDLVNNLGWTINDGGQE